MLLRWYFMKQRKMCDKGLKGKTCYTHEEEWPKRYSHSAGPNGGQPVSGHLLFALLPLLYFVCLCVWFPSFFLSLSLSLSLSVGWIETEHDFPVAKFKRAHHDKRAIQSSSNSGKMRTYLKVKAANTEQEESHWSLERNRKARWTALV